MHAVVFSGGGAKGVYQAYEFVMQLEERKIPPPDIIYGSSVGALNAAVYAYKGPQRLLELWWNIRGRSDILGFNWIPFFRTGIYNSKPLKKLLAKYVEGEPCCKVTVCNVDLVSEKLNYVSNAHVSLPVFRNAVRASASIPVTISPIENRYYYSLRVDGGVRERAPLHQAIKEGADIISVFLCNPFDIDRFSPITGLNKNILGIASRAIDIMGHEIIANDLNMTAFINELTTHSLVADKKKVDLRVFCPPWSQFFIHTFDFHPKKIRSVIGGGIRMEDVSEKIKQGAAHRTKPIKMKVEENLAVERATAEKAILDKFSAKDLEKRKAA